MSKDYAVHEFDPAMDDFTVVALYAKEDNALKHLRRLPATHTRAVVHRQPDGESKVIASYNAGQES